MTATATLCLALGLGLAGCSGKPDESQRGKVGFVQGFLGGVVADEPRAALVGREILSTGGSAADAAAATYFALAVTLPSTATLGGGGVCLVLDSTQDKVEMLDFVAPAPNPSLGPQAAAVPMNVRGFFVLHSRFGRLKWERLAAPAANMARFGVPLSRAFARELSQAGGILAQDATARRLFFRPDGSAPLGEGGRLTQVDLAAMLDRIRTQGPGDMYVGAGARELMQAYRTAGFALDRAALNDTVPVWRVPSARLVEARGRRATAYFTVPPAGAGSVAGQILAALGEKNAYARGGATERAAMFVDAARRVPAEGLSAPTAGSAATSIVAADRDGQVVACALTPNLPFGAGRVAPGTGILIAAPPPGGACRPDNGLGAKDAAGSSMFGACAPGGARTGVALAAMIVDARDRAGALFAAASGGAISAYAVAQTAAAAMFEGLLLEDALAQGRFVSSGPAGGAPHEAAVNALACPGGLRENPQTCSLRPDPRGLGLAAMSD